MGARRPRAEGQSKGRGSAHHERSGVTQRPHSGARRWDALPTLPDHLPGATVTLANPHQAIAVVVPSALSTEITTGALFLATGWTAPLSGGSTWARAATGDSHLHPLAVTFLLSLCLDAVGSAGGRTEDGATRVLWRATKPPRL